MDIFNRPEFLFIIFGSWLAGAMVTLLNILLKTEEVMCQLEDSGAKIIFLEWSF